MATCFPPVKLAQEDSTTCGTYLPQLPPALLALLEEATRTNPPPPDSLPLHLTAAQFCRPRPLRCFPNLQVIQSLFSAFAPHPCSVLALCLMKYM
jgi:hypothetical protein